MNVLNGSLEIITIMEVGFVGAARSLHWPMTCRKALLFFTALSFSKKRNTFHLAHTKMKTYHKAG
jgi:hypothetical protein